MSKTDVSTVVKHYPSAQDGYTSTLSSTVIAPAATVPINGGLAGYDDGDVVAFIVDPGDATKEQVVTGTVDTAGSQLTGCKWLRGTNTTHTAGATVVDYWNAAHVKMFTKGLLAAGLTQAGGMGAISPTSITSTGTITAASFVQTGSGNNTGWNVGLAAPTSVTALGNRSYSILWNGNDYSTTLSPGMRGRTTRTVAGQTYMGGAFNGTNHYFTKVTPTGTLSTVTDNFTVMAIYRPTSYTAGMIMGRADSTPNNSIILRMDTDGTVWLQVNNGGAANFRILKTCQSLPLNKSTTIFATWAAGVGAIYFDGVSVPLQATTTGGTAPTTAGTGGDFSIGRAGAFNSTYCSGYVSNAAVFSSVLSAATILSYGTYILTGAEPTCIGAWSLNNVATDATGTNNLTATNGVSYSNSFSPMGTQADGSTSSTLDYHIYQKISVSGGNTTAIVQVPEGCTIPTSGGVSSVVYSSNKAPYGMPVQRGKWTIGSVYKTNLTQTSAVQNTWYNVNAQLNVPLGEWFAEYCGIVRNTSSSAAFLTAWGTLSSSNNSESDPELTSWSFSNITAATDIFSMTNRRKALSVTTQSNYYLNIRTTQVGSTSLLLSNDQFPATITFENAYL